MRYASSTIRLGIVNEGEMPQRRWMFEKRSHAAGFSSKINKALVARGQVEWRSHAKVSSQSRISDSDVNPTNTAGWQHRTYNVFKVDQSRLPNLPTPTFTEQVVIGVQPSPLPPSAPLQGIFNQHLQAVDLINTPQVAGCLPKTAPLAVTLADGPPYPDAATS